MQTKAKPQNKYPRNASCPEARKIDTLKKINEFMVCYLYLLNSINCVMCLELLHV